MHQSGHSRAQSMHTVQFSSFRAMTPRERGGRGAISSGYCTVTALDTMWRMVIPRPLSSPVPNVAFLSFDSSFSVAPFLLSPVGQLQRASDEDVDQRQRDEHLPRELLELILPQTGEGPPDPDQQEDDEAGLDDEPYRPRHEPKEREQGDVAAEEQGGGQGRHPDHGDVLGGEEAEGELHGRVLGEGPRD